MNDSAAKVARGAPGARYVAYVTQTGRKFGIALRVSEETLQIISVEAPLPCVDKTDVLRCRIESGQCGCHGHTKHLQFALSGAVLGLEVIIRACMNSDAQRK